jgi:hypothetical protein
MFPTSIQQRVPRLMVTRKNRGRRDHLKVNPGMLEANPGMLDEPAVRWTEISSDQI